MIQREPNALVDLLFEAQTVLGRRLNYIENLVVSMTCRKLRGYKPNAVELIRNKMNELGVEYIDLKGKGAYLTGGFLVQAVYGMNWPESDIDLFSPFSSVLKQPYYPEKSHLDEDFEQNHFETVENRDIGRYYTGKYNFIPNYHILHSLISTELYEHPNICYYWDKIDYWETHEDAEDWNHTKSKRRDCWLKFIDMESGVKGDSYTRILHLHSIKDFYLLPRQHEGEYRRKEEYQNGDDEDSDDDNGSGHRVFYPDWKSKYRSHLRKKAIKVQDIILEDDPVFTIEETLAAFDINLCRMYFDGEVIRMQSVEEIAQMTIKCRVVDPRFYQGELVFGRYRKTYERLEKYGKRFGQTEFVMEMPK